jgi:hypothetical protein
LSGQNSYNFVPGDNTNHITQFAYSGAATDICAALS